jgi:hypothetical protein
MSAVPASIKAPLEPQVNLLPPEVTARRAKGRQRGLILFGFVVFLVLAAASVYLASSQEASAKRERDKEVAIGVDLQAQIDAYQYVLDVQAELARVTSARTYVGSTEIEWGDLLREIQANLPMGMVLNSITWSSSSILQVVDPEASLFAQPDIGSLKINGQMATYVTSSQLEEYLNRVPGLARATVSTITRTQNSSNGVVTYTFDASVRITALALSGRFGAEWIIADARDQAVNVLRNNEAVARAYLDVVMEANDGNLEAPSVIEATAALDLATGDLEEFLALQSILETAEAGVVAAEASVAAGEEGAEQALADATEARDAIVSALGQLTAVVRKWNDATSDLSTIESRIAAATTLVASSETAVAEAQVAVAEGTSGAAEALVMAQDALTAAQATLVEEQSYGPDAEAAVTTARAEVDAAMAASFLLTSADPSASSASASASIAGMGATS